MLSADSEKKCRIELRFQLVKRVRDVITFPCIGTQEGGFFQTEKIVDLSAFDGLDP